MNITCSEEICLNKVLSFFILSIIFFILILSISSPFILNTINLKTSNVFYNSEKNYPIELNLLYNDSKNTPPTIELRKGKYIVVFLSLTCPHCRLAANKLGILKKQHPEYPIYFVLNGRQEDLNSFFNESNSVHVPHSMFLGPTNFLKLSGKQFPSICLVNNSIVNEKLNYLSINSDIIDKWLK